MARALSQYLRIYSGATTYKRWQSYYVGSTVTWSSQSWTYHPFEADGLVQGQVGNDRLTLTVPATVEAVSSFEAALGDGRLVELSLYEFDTNLGNETPQAAQVLVASYLGEVAAVEGDFTELQVDLGSSLAPVGSQVPPRKYTNILIGNPCRL